MYDILLVQPKIGIWDTIRSEFAPPLSLLSICRLIYKKYRIKIIDQRINSNWKKELIEIIENNNLICVGITSMIGEQIYHVINISKLIKSFRPNIPIVLGGVQATLTPEILIKSKYIDIIVLGEGEETFYELIEHLNQNKDIFNIKGIIFKRNNQIIRTPSRNLLDLDKLPSIPYHLVDMRKYLPKYGYEETFYFQTSRGCPNKCIYCYNVPFNRQQWRAMSADKVIYEMKKIIREYKIHHFYFVDDNFFVDMKRAEKIIDKIIKENLNIHWQIQGVEIISLLKMDENFLYKLEKSGLKRITVGIESGSLKILKFLGKRYNISQILEVNNKIKKFNIIVFYSIICGFPNETIKDLKKTISLVLKILKDNPNARFSPFYACTPFPGTELYHYCHSQGFIKEKKISTLITNTYDFMNADYFSKKKNKCLNNLIFISLFIDKKFLEYNFSKFNLIFKFLLNIYRYFARFRLKYLKFNFLFEKIIFDRFIKTLFNIKNDTKSRIN
ncbi:MAG: B12-binding domain-containing radical SAM protein [Candidatus Helarchaeota archaeon]